MKRPASEVLYAYTLLQQPLAIMDVMQVCNLHLSFRLPLLWFMLYAKVKKKNFFLKVVWGISRKKGVGFSFFFFLEVEVEEDKKKAEGMG